jgi:glyoxylase-like metal-dependent hydrolase (beta-lactamase superfamily II)
MVVALGISLFVGGLTAVVMAQNNFDKVEIKTEKLADGVWVMYGAGGNIGLCAGSDGALLIDDQYAELSPKILAAAKQAGGQPIRWVVNTHWHGDHVGGNTNMTEAGALVFAQDRVRDRLLEGQDNKFFGRKVPPASGKALPVVTFGETTTLHVNGEDAVAFHVAPAHTDGDVMVWFPKANVLHMGDTFFNGLYPIIDLESGGSVDGMIGAAELALAQVKANTKIIPGHGPVTARSRTRSRCRPTTTCWQACVPRSPSSWRRRRLSTRRSPRSRPRPGTTSGARASSSRKCSRRWSTRSCRRRSSDASRSGCTAGPRR